MKILVRSPYYGGSGDFFSCEFEPTSTIEELKAYLETNYPTVQLATPLPVPFAKQNMRLIYSGRLLFDNETIEQAIQAPLGLSTPPSASAPIFHLFLSPSQANSNNNANIANNNINPAFFQQRGQALFNPQMMQQGAMMQPGPAPMPPQQNQPPRESAFGLILKLGLLYLLLSRGGSTERNVVLAIIAVILFLWKTGRIRVRAVVAHVNPQLLQQPQQPQQPQPNQQNNNNEQPRAPAPIPRNRNFLNEVEDFVVPFVYSLFPNWHPQQHYQQQPPQPQQQPQQQPQPQVPANQHPHAD